MKTTQGRRRTTTEIPAAHIPAAKQCIAIAMVASFVHQSPRLEESEIQDPLLLMDLILICNSE
uniref:Uncharacterized protein n=1 Tax=Oryza meridionalis TaxID=40149 RepID=A0A0E0EXM7_9ORYZ